VVTEGNELFRVKIDGDWKNIDEYIYQNNLDITQMEVYEVPKAPSPEVMVENEILKPRVPIVGVLIEDEMKESAAADDGDDVKMYESEKEMKEAVIKEAKKKEAEMKDAEMKEADQKISTFYKFSIPDDWAESELELHVTMKRNEVEQVNKKI
jgi:IS4 transposase